MLLCRNTLMYFNAETQSRILRRFNFALKDDGYLVLGKSETLIAHTSLFSPSNSKRRVFQKVARATERERLPAIRRVAASTRDAAVYARETAFDMSPVAQLVISAEGGLLLANEAARSMLSIASADLGRPLQDLE